MLAFAGNRCCAVALRNTTISGSFTTMRMLRRSGVVLIVQWRAGARTVAMQGSWASAIARSVCSYVSYEYDTVHCTGALLLSVPCRHHDRV